MHLHGQRQEIRMYDKLIYLHTMIECYRPIYKRGGAEREQTLLVAPSRRLPGALGRDLTLSGHELWSRLSQKVTCRVVTFTHDFSRDFSEGYTGSV